MLTVGFFTLQYGVHIDNFTVKNLNIEQLYIKWNEKIDLSVKKIELKSNKNSTQNTSLNLKEIRTILESIYHFQHIFSKIDIKELKVNNINSSFLYDKHQYGHFKANSKTLILNAFLYFQDEKLAINIHKFKDSSKKLDIKGMIVINNNLEFISDINININKLQFKLLTSSSKQRLKYAVYSNQNIKDITYIVDLFHLPESIRYWIIDAIDMKYVHLNKAYGWIDYADLNNAYKNINVVATLTKLNYTYDTKLDSIHTSHTILTFKNGILLIEPKNAYTYKQELNKSTVTLDFNNKEVKLQIHLLFQGKLDKNILKILNNYHIKLPLIQNKGKLDVDLYLDVNLNTFKVTSHGVFYTKEANIDYLGFNFNIFDTNITLQDANVTTSNMQVYYKNIAFAHLAFDINARKSSGYIKIDLEKFTLNDINLSLVKKPEPIFYLLPENKIKITSSQWNFFNHSIQIDRLNTFYKKKTNSLVIPTTRVQIDQNTTLFASGRSYFDTNITNINIDVLEFMYNNILKMNQEKADINVVYNNGFYFDFMNDINFKFSDINITTTQTQIKIKDNTLKIKSKLNSQNLFKTNIKLDYTLDNNKGIASLNSTKIKDIFEHNQSLQLAVNYTDKNLTIISKELSTNFNYYKDKSKITFHDINKITPYSIPISNLNINEANLSLIYTNDAPYIQYEGYFHYAYPILVSKKTPIYNYKINGIYNTKVKNHSLTLNNNLNIQINDNIHLSLKNDGINVFALVDAIHSNAKTQKNSKNLDVYLEAKDSFLYISPHRRLLADSIHLIYDKNITSALLKFKEGSAKFQLNNDDFFVQGSHFNDTFMDNFFALSDFKGGTLDFSVYGTTNEYDGIINVNKTIIKDYKLLNNVLSFVNTIPSLVTFSVPGYNKHGLKVKNSYINFHAKKNIFHLSDIYLDSKEIDILGRGIVDFHQNKVDLKLNLKTDLASSLSKIPIVGHIIFDNESVSTTLKVTGKLNNPKVKSLIAKEMVVAPLNIIKRTIMLPYYLFADKNTTK